MKYVEDMLHLYSYIDNPFDLDDFVSDFGEATITWASLSRSESFKHWSSSPFD